MNFLTEIYKRPHKEPVFSHQFLKRGLTNLIGTIYVCYPTILGQFLFPLEITYVNLIKGPI